VNFARQLTNNSTLEFIHKCVDYLKLVTFYGIHTVSIVLLAT